MRARAVEVKRSAAMLSLGTVRSRLSSVMVPTTTIVLPAEASGLCLGLAVDAMREIDMGGRLMRDMKRRLRITRLKAESVRPVWKGMLVGCCFYWALLIVCFRWDIGLEMEGELWVRTSEEAV